MSTKLVWSSDMTKNYFLNLIDQNTEDAIDELVDYGYEKEMLENKDKDFLKQVVLDDDYFWQMNSEDFEYEVRPMIENQTRDGIVLMCGTAGDWKGNHDAGKAVYVEDLVGGDICPDCNNIAIYGVDGELQWQGCHHDGCHYMNLYALPEDREKFGEFVEVCMPDYIEDLYIDNDEDSMIDIIDDIDSISIEDINNYCDFSRIPSVCESIKNFGRNVQESIEIKETKEEDLIDLEMEAATLKADFEDFGPDGFYAVSYKKFKNQFPIFCKKVLESFLKSAVGVTNKEIENGSIFEEYWQSGELILPEDWPMLIDGVDTILNGKNLMWSQIVKKYYKAPNFDTYTSDSNEN